MTFPIIRASVLATFLIFVSAPATAQFEQFQKEYKTPAFTQVYDIAPTPDGGYVYVGLENIPTLPDPLTPFITKLDCNGEPEWKKRFGGTSGLNNIDHKVVVLPNNEYVLLSSQGGSAVFDILLVRLAADGSTIWRQAYGGNNEDIPGGITLLSDGNLGITGHTNSFGANVGTNFGDIYVLKIDVTDGSVIWSRTFGFTGTISRGYGIVENDLGGVAVTGTVFHAPTVANWAPLLQLDADGNLISTHFYGLQNRNTNAQDISRSADGGYLLSGFSNILGADWFDILTLPVVMKVDAEGALLWGSVLEGTPNASGLGGTAYTPVDNGDTVGVAMDAYFYPNQTVDPTKRLLALLDSDDGSLLNVRQYNLEGGQFTRMKPDRDGGYIMSAFTDENNGSDPGDQFWAGPILNKLDRDFNSGCNETDRTTATNLFQPDWTTEQFTFDVEDSGANLFTPGISADSFSVHIPETETFCEKEWIIGGSFSFVKGLCTSDTVFFTNELSSPNWIDIVWDFGDGTTVSGIANPTHVYDAPGPYTITLTTTYCNNQAVMNEREIIINENTFGAGLSPTTTDLCPGLPIDFNLSVSSAQFGPVDWDFGDGNTVQTPEDESTVQHIFEEAGAFTVTASLTYCDEPYEVTYDLLLPSCDSITCEELLPTAFSPNGDGTNDEFCVLQGDQFTSLELMVYNRWGEQIFSSQSATDCWDGRLDGEELPSDAYAYMLTVETIEGEIIRCFGEINLIR